MSEWADLGTEREFRSNEFLWYQGDPAGTGAYLIDGVLGVEKVSQEGERVVFTELQPGAVLGEMSCLDGKPHSASVKALATSRVRLFTARELDRFLADDPSRLRYLLVRQNERLRYLTEKVLRIGTESVLKRLTYWLLEQDAPEVNSTHQDIAAHLATTRESVSKSIAYLRKIGLITSKRGLLTVTDRKELASTLQGFR